MNRDLAGQPTLLSSRGHEDDPAEHLAGCHLLVSQPGRRRLVKLCTKRFRGNVMDPAPWDTGSPPAAGRIGLRCTIAEFEKLDPAEMTVPLRDSPVTGGSGSAGT